MHRFQPDSSCTKPALNILSFAHAAHAFVNGTYAGMMNSTCLLMNWTFRSHSSGHECFIPATFSEGNYPYAGGAHGNHDVKNFMLETPILLDSGMNYISILSVMAGLPVYSCV